MLEKPLNDKKIGILVESLYIPEEINAYRQGFADLGAQVDLLSRLWGQPSQRFVSDPNGLHPIQTLDVTLDFANVNLEDYAAIIMSANYTSVRLRYFDPSQAPSEAPAVRFFSKAMQNPNIVKGALCHGLWILTPMPNLLRDRKVICHEVVRADVLNAGGVYTPSSGGVVVDGDLVTGHSKDDVNLFIDTIARLIATRT